MFRFCIHANTPSSGLSYMDFQKLFWWTLSGCFQSKNERGWRASFQKLEGSHFFAKSCCKSIFCEQPPVDALKVKIKEDGEHFRKVAGSQFFVIWYRLYLFVYSIHFRKQFFGLQPPMDAFIVKIKQDGVTFSESFRFSIFC